MTLSFAKANKSKSKLRCAIFGPSGGGKTFTSLRIAKGMGGKVAVIDTERGSASKYADRFEFDVLDLPQNDIDTYIMAIGAAAKEGYDVLIIDSLSHGWAELLQEIDRLAATQFRGNTWSAWSKGTPKQKRLVDAILSYDGHVIATMRSKTEWTTTKNDRGKNTPQRVGLTPEQGKGIEYEFDLLLELSTEHMATVIKDRTGKYQDKVIEKPGEEFGADLKAWLSEGVEPEAKPVQAAPDPTPEQPAPKPEGSGNAAVAAAIASDGAEVLGDEGAARINSLLTDVGATLDQLREAMRKGKKPETIIGQHPRQWLAEWEGNIEGWCDRYAQAQEGGAS